MAGAGAEPPPFRASDADRERVVRLLRDSAVEGRLAHDSFVRRLDLALEARDQRSLGELVVDLPGSVRFGPRRGLGRLDRLLDQVAPRSRRRRLPVLRLPGGRQSALTIGRSRGCDLVLADSTVSRVHAVLRRFGDEWFLEDLGSTNGTRLNGFTIRAATAVRPGDWVGVGRLTFRVARSGRP